MYEVQGLWGSFVLVVFTGIYILAIPLLWRIAYPVLVILSILALAFSYLTGFTIGGFYMPAGVGLFIGMLILVFARLLSQS